MNEVYLTLQFAGVVVLELAQTGLEVVKNRLFDGEQDHALDDWRNRDDDREGNERRNR